MNGFEIETIRGEHIRSMMLDIFEKGEHIISYGQFKEQVIKRL